MVLTWLVDWGEGHGSCELFNLEADNNDGEIMCKPCFNVSFQGHNYNTSAMELDLKPLELLFDFSTSDLNSQYAM
jgi:hypothetical protein